MTVDPGDAIGDLVLAVVGIGQAALLHAGAGLQAGRPVPVLPGYRVWPDTRIWAVHPPGKVVMIRVDALLDFMASRTRAPGTKPFAALHVPGRMLLRPGTGTPGVCQAAWGIREAGRAALFCWSGKGFPGPRNVRAAISVYSSDQPGGTPFDLTQRDTQMKAVGDKKPCLIDREDALIDITLEKPQAPGRDLLVNIPAVSLSPANAAARQTMSAPETG